MHEVGEINTINMKYLWHLFCLMKVTDNAHYVALQLDFVTVSWNLNNQSLGEHPRDWPPKWRHPGELSVYSPRGSAQSTKGDWLFGPAKGEWNRDAYFIKMYKVKNCLEKKIGFLLSRPLSVELPSNLLHCSRLLSSEQRVLYLPAFMFSVRSCIIKVSPILLDKKLYTCSKIISQIVISGEKFDI